nr:Chain C, DECAMERIC PEPTIDE FROM CALRETICULIN [Homo sapiens]2CLR_F Chain F, DECAMERIC PEPTIDE FROM CALRETICULIN [Homo sapiens]
MLLSVPLLLG